MSCNGWKHLKNYRLNDDFCARNIEMRDASRKKTGSSHLSPKMQTCSKTEKYIQRNASTDNLPELAFLD